jgi:hypothetical protein
MIESVESDDPFDPLTQFMQWWLAGRYISTPDTGTQASFNEGFSGIVLFRERHYQVQLFIIEPNSISLSHVHPNVDSYEVFVGGDLQFTVEGVAYGAGSFKTEDPLYNLVKGVGNRFLPTAWHDGITGEGGASFLSIQRWLNGVSPHSIADDWIDVDKNTIGAVKKL